MLAYVTAAVIDKMCSELINLAALAVYCCYYLDYHGKWYAYLY